MVPAAVFVTVALAILRFVLRRKRTAWNRLAIALTFTIGFFVLAVFVYLQIAFQIRNGLPSGSDTAWERFKTPALIGFGLIYVITIALSVWLGLRLRAREGSAVLLVGLTMAYLVLTGISTEFLAQCFIGQGFGIFGSLC